MPSRRDVLRAGGALCLGALSGCVARAFDAPETPPGEWRTARRDARNAAYAPDATPPTDPAVAWTRSFGSDGRVESVLVARGNVYAVRPTETTILDSETGETRRTTGGAGQTPGDGATRVAAVGEDSLYTADGAAVRAFDPDGSLRWETRRPGVPDGAAGRVYGLVVTDDGVLCGTHDGVAAFDAGGGTHRWTFGRGGMGGFYPAVAGERVYVCSPGPTYALSRPSPFGALFGGGPSPAWEQSSPGPGTWPVVTDGPILVGDGDRRGDSGRTRPLLAIARDGSVEWRASASGAVVGLAVAEEESLAVSVRFDAASEEGRVVAVETATGETAWERDDIGITDDFSGSVVVAGDTCLVAGFSKASANPIRALDAATGETQWRRTVDGDVTSVVPAGERVYAATTLGNLVAFE
ncbi:outer membrane protein assembly factor BamB family protein [Halopelagius longus]|uniref:Outer membrane protein assembly factor BamB, contains PQQ-like beta-propeller repeat n=1 Tax=Halopelagius longus TaxID=1236180 RepID=A0A1H1BYP6_9EURY|nr:PQQ-binding-like beta-propeller repeat protein [Halopelagius longus]RDI70983.1 hypothetical protein DWB78_04155 [Halopelagius longus]SDQ57009.1 Outer membrane protein assembly factor BamB, contains PQQ-like beta-propeller repeat [Halopelagius longus]